jgi:Glycine-zipper domain/HdeA/HdeB family
MSLTRSGYFCTRAGKCLPALALCLGAASWPVGAKAFQMLAQYYPPPPGYYAPPPPGAYAPYPARPPCPAVTPGPLRGAARGAAGGAAIGAISGNAGRWAAIGATVGESPVRRGLPLPDPMAPAIEQSEEQAGMIKVAVVALGTFALLAGCATSNSPPPAAPPPQPAPAAANPPAYETPLPSPDQVWDVNAVRCEQRLGAADDDRASVGMFYYGWLAGNHGIHQIRPAAIQPNLHKVLEFCEQHPQTTIVNAFRAVLAPHKRG